MGCDVAYPEEAPVRHASVGSFVFVPPRRPVSPRDHGAWWSFVPGACWRAPLGQGSDLASLERHPVVHVA